MKILAVIPARGGSKGLPRKNALMLAGKPILAYTLEDLAQSKYEIEAIVTTDDAEITDIAQSFGISVVARPPELANDLVASSAAVRHAAATYDWQADIVLEMYASTPIRPDGIVDRVIEVMSGTDVTGAFTVIPAGHYHPRRSVALDQRGRLTFPYGQPASARQLDEERYFLAGCLRAAKWQYLLNTRNPSDVYDAFGPVRVGVPIDPAEFVDIDNDLDFRWAEFLISERRP